MSIATDIEYVGSKISNIDQIMSKTDHYKITTSKVTIRDQIDEYMRDYMGKLTAMSCNSCGGNIDPTTMLCKSCGTQYRLEISR